MKINSTYSFLGGGFAFLLATMCCWLPVLTLTLGGAAGLAVFTEGLEDYSGMFMFIGVVLLSTGAYQLYNKQKSTKDDKLILNSTITCPECGFKRQEQMPENACQYFYECHQCHLILKPRKGDCCVFCSYGTVACPPIQKNESCCD